MNQEVGLHQTPNIRHFMDFPAPRIVKNKCLVSWGVQSVAFYYSGPKGQDTWAWLSQWNQCEHSLRTQLLQCAQRTQHMGHTKGCLEWAHYGLPHWQGNLPDSKSLKSCSVARNLIRSDRELHGGHWRGSPSLIFKREVTLLGLLLYLYCITECSQHLTKLTLLWRGSSCFEGGTKV